MDQNNLTCREWLAAAVKDIHFRPDREAVERELWEHIEDKTADLVRIFLDMTWEEAEARALSDMGDPEEMARELAKIHKPWLGYLWKFSRTVRKISLFALVISLLVSQQRWNQIDGWYASGDEWMLYREELVMLEPDRARASVNGDWITMERAVLDREWKRVGVKLRVWSPAFWEGRSGNLKSLVTAVDDRGNIHPSYMEFWAEDMTTEKRTISYVSSESGGCGPFYQDYIFWVQEVNLEAKWLRLEYDWLGRKFEFTINLTEETDAWKTSGRLS